MADTTTYSVVIKGEQHTYTVESWRTLTFADVCKILSDLTGYRVDFLARDLPKRFDHLGYALVRPADVYEGGTPTFLIRSSDGTSPSVPT
jgi:hypothetical protein